MAAVGIDLGTTNSVVAVYEHGRVVIITNDQGKRTTPSYVAFTDNELLVGAAATNQFALNPLNTVFDAKRLIGMKVGDELLRKYKRHWPFTVDENEDKPRIVVTHKYQKKRFYPEEISAMVLGKLKQAAEDYLGEKVTKAVITVPAYFNDAQRQATKAAGRIAGLEVLRLFNEPTAVTIAYAFDKQITSSTILVVDLGGGTFDVSILVITGRHYIVKSVAGDSHLGGEDFDDKIVEYLVKDFKKKTKLDITGSKKAIQRLRVASEKAKKALSANIQTRVEIDSLFQGIDYSTILRRSRFEDLNGEHFDKLLVHVKSALDDANMDKSKIDHVVLAGGSTWIPMVRKIIQDFFNGKEINKSINPDEAIAYGAAILAAKLGGGNKCEKIVDMVLQDVIPLSLGIAIRGNTMSTVIPRNTKVPATKTEEYSTHSDNQTSALIKVFEGERKWTEDNHFLGSFDLTGIPPLPKGEGKLQVTFDIDENCLLKVTAMEKATQNKNVIVIAHDTGRFNEKELERLISAAETQREENQYRLKAIDEKNELEKYVYDIKSRIEDDERSKTRISAADKDEVLKLCEKMINWLELEDQVDVITIRLEKSRLQRVWDPLERKLL